MSLGVSHRLLLAVASLTALASIFSGSAVTQATTLLGAAAVFVAAFLPRRPAPLALRIVVHGVTVLALGFAAIVWSRSRIDAGLLVAVLGLANRHLLHAGLRDDGIILGLSAVLLAAGTMITPSVSFVGLFVLFVVSCSWAAHSATVVSLVPRDDPGRQAWEAQRLGGKARMALGLIVSTLVAFAVFSAFPRWQFASWLSAGAFFDLSGASERMDLTNAEISSASLGRVAVRVFPEGVTQTEVEGLYVRLFNLDEYEQGGFRGRWRRTAGPATSLRSSNSYRPARRVRVEFERVVPRTSVHPVPAVGRRAPVRPLQSGLRSSVSGTWVGGTRRSQRVLRTEHDLANLAPVLPPTEEVRRRSLSLPEDLDPRFTALASRLTEALPPSGRIDAIIGHFSSGYTYSLEAREGESDDPLARFTFEAKAGHCELYAAAAVVLLRAADVPARVATGYHGGRWNEAGGYVEMGAADAHAWVEAFDDTTQTWRWVDATPEDERSNRVREAWAALSDLWDQAEVLWYDYIIDYDEGKRRQLFGRFADWDISPSAETESQDGSKKLTSSGGSLGAALVAALIAAGGAVLWWMRRRNLGGRLVRALGGDTRDHPPVERLLAGVSQSILPEAAAAVRHYQRWRFGHQGERREVNAAITSLERAVRRAR